MKKLFSLAVMVLSAATAYAGGLYEYNGRNYYGGSFAGIVAQEYASKQHSQKEYEKEYNSAITDNKLYFMGPVSPVGLQDVLKRGYIQNGDEFLITEDYPNTAVYTGPQKNVKGLLSSNDDYCYGIGYAVYGGAITIVELATVEELDNNPKIKPIE